MTVGRVHENVNQIRQNIILLEREDCQLFVIHYSTYQLSHQMQWFYTCPYVMPMAWWM